MESSQNGEIVNNDRFHLLKNESISVKDIASIVNFSIRHSNKIKQDVLKEMGKPPDYLLTFGEFLSSFHRVNPEVLIDRFWELRFKK